MTYNPTPEGPTTHSHTTPTMWGHLKQVSWGAIFAGVAVALVVQVLLTLLGVVENRVGLADLLELLFRCRIARILVRMILHGELAKCRLENLFVACPLDTEHFVVIDLYGHLSTNPRF